MKKMCIIYSRNYKILLTSGDIPGVPKMTDNVLQLKLYEEKLVGGDSLWRDVTLWGCIFNVDTLLGPIALKFLSAEFTLQRCRLYLRT